MIFDEIPMELVLLFEITGIVTIICITWLFMVLFGMWAKERFDKFIRIRQGKNLYHCCQRCGSYTPYYKTRHGNKWKFSIYYCPNCGHDMEEDRKRFIK